MGLGEDRLLEIKDELANSPASSSLAAALHSSKWRLAANSTWQSWWMEANFDKPCPIIFGGINPAIFYRPQTSKPRYVAGFSGDPRSRKGTKFVTEAIALARPYIPLLTGQSYHGRNLTQRRMADWYASCTIFVDGQLWAGWNNPVVEAMACGTPVVCTDIGGNLDFAKHRLTAWVVPKGDAAQLADGIINLLTDSTTRRILADNAYNWVQQYTWPASAEQFIKVVSQ